MANLSGLEQSIHQVDGIRVSLAGNATTLPDYWKTRFKAEGTVTEFKTRFVKRYPGIAIEVFDGVGRRAHGNYLLKNLRATYDFTWVQEEYGSMILSFEEIFRDQKRRIRALKKALRKSAKPAAVKEETFDPYQILKVGPDASDEDIKLAYKKRIQIFHPDKFSGMDELIVEFATDKAQQINLAREEIARLRSSQETD
ncbi:J domain-containing protein [Telluria beijingensis]|uniref:J domain-containing protein n=1 Tax=Telluria beijingensis TaxID=3068633 RepID=UPI002795D49C|nr:J domain-containing protein [Massilia sp. REN29]